MQSKVRDLTLEQVAETDVFENKFWQGEPTKKRKVRQTFLRILHMIYWKGILDLALGAQRNFVNPLVGEDEIMQQNIINVIRGLKILKNSFKYQVILSGFSPETTVKKVVMFFTNNESSLYSEKFIIRSKVDQTPDS